MKLRILSTVFCLSVSASAWSEYFSFEQIPNPTGIDPQVGAMDSFSDGRIAVAFHRGEVMIYDPSDKSWSLFAAGLHEPLGMLIEADGSILVMQRAELTRLKDSDGDGVAEEYETVYDDFGMSGNYHEFSYGPARDAEGNLYVALGIASNGAPMREEIRGEFSEIGKLNREEMSIRNGWGKYKARAGRMYARVAWRGWVMKISPDGSKAEPFASGLRSPNGIGFDANGRLLVTDNQGDWRPTSPLYDIKEGGFYGHPASLVWKQDWDGSDPMDMDVDKLDAMQEKPAGYFPQGELANSPTWPVVVPKGALPEALVGQTLIGEMNQPCLVRVLDDEVNGKYQAGMLSMFDGSPLGRGNNRIAFGKDGSIYVGKTKLSWAGSSGITRIKWNGKPFFAVQAMKAVPNGFAVRFTEKVDPSTVGSIKAESNTYAYWKKYGAPKKDLEEIEVTSTELLEDGKTIVVKLGKFKQGYLHALDMSGFRSADGKKLMGNKVWYQLNEAP